MNIKAKIKQVGNFVKTHPTDVIAGTGAALAVVCTIGLNHDRQKLLSLFNFLNDQLSDGEVHVVQVENNNEEGFKITIGEAVRWVEDKKQYIGAESGEIEE